MGTGVGLVGLALVLLPGVGSGSTAVGLLVMVAASMSWSIGSFVSPRLTMPGDPFVASALEMLFGGLFLTAGALAVGEGGRLDGHTFAAGPVAAWIYLVLVGSLVGFSAYAWLLRAASISLVVTHQYVNPLVAITLGVLVLGERPSALALVGAALVVGAVYAAVRSEAPRREQVPQPPRSTADQPA